MLRPRFCVCASLLDLSFPLTTDPFYVSHRAHSFPASEPCYGPSPPCFPIGLGIRPGAKCLVWLQPLLRVPLVAVHIVALNKYWLTK